MSAAAVLTAAPTLTGRLFVDGAWRTGAGPAFASVDPAYGRTVWEGPEASPADVADAVAAARRALPGWSGTAFEDRVAALERFKTVLDERKDALARLIAEETGKPLWEGAAEAGAMIGKVAISIAAYHERTGAKANDTPFGQATLAHRPHGVMAVLGPYNFPGHLPNGHIVPALLAGNTVVFKPSELTPAVGEALVDALAAADLPAGVVNLVQGARGVGEALLDADIDGVLFTGSATTGAAIHKRFGGRPEVMLALEMGGNNPLIVWDAKDAEAAASIVFQSAFATSGQRCTCARRLIVEGGPDGAGRAVVEALQALMDRVVVAPFDADPAPFMGPVVSAVAAERVVQAQAAALATPGVDAPMAVGLPDRPAALLADQGPAFVAPGLIDMTGRDAADEEIFGPVLQVVGVGSFDEALAAANATRFGLSAGLVSDDAALWARAQAELRAGIMNWNRPTTGAASNLPFGGPGLSGNHRPSAYYAADYCAYPVASQVAPAVAAMPITGLR